MDDSTSDHVDQTQQRSVNSKLSSERARESDGEEQGSPHHKRAKSDSDYSSTTHTKKSKKSKKHKKHKSHKKHSYTKIQSVVHTVSGNTRNDILL